MCEILTLKYTLFCVFRCLTSVFFLHPLGEKTELSMGERVCLVWCGATRYCTLSGPC